MNNVFILAGPVQSGKTTALLNYFAGNPRMGGFICPDVNGQRMIFFLAESNVVPFQIVEKENEVAIGKFTFDKIVFSKACDVLVNPSTLASDVVVVDEVGPLELKEQGYFQSLAILLDKWKNKSDGKLILVVRTHLVNEVIAKFNLKGASIITINDLKVEIKLTNKVNALILAGGNSTRMNLEKYLLEYDGVPQYKRLQHIFEQMQLPVYLSCNINQNQNSMLSIESIVDRSDYADAGPLTGILSAYESLQSDLMIVGCDYPLLAADQLAVLKQFLGYGFNEIAFVKKDRPEIAEPLICYLSTQSLKQLKQFYLNGGRSLNKYLQLANPLKIQLSDESFLRSFDTPEDYHSYKLL